MRDYDKLDLLGVQYDAEMEIKAKYELAEKIASKHTYRYGEEFEKICFDEIRKELGKDAYPSDVNDVWFIIKEKYL